MSVRWKEWMNLILNGRQLFLGGAVALSIWISPTSSLGSPLLLSRLAGAAASTQAEDVVAELGGRVLHRFPPNHLIAELDPGREGTLAELLGSGWAFGSGEIESPRDPAHFAFNRLIRPDTDRGPPAGGLQKENYSIGKPLVGDYMIPPAYGDAGKGGASTAYGPYGAGFWDGSEYLLGSVGVAVVFVESDGSVDVSSEDWAAGEKSHVTAEVVEAMDWWMNQTTLGPLSFTYEYYYDVAVSYEPITRPQSQESLWITEAIAGLGFSGSDRFTESERFVNDMKDRLGTDWAFIVYVVDSSNDADGMFSSGHFAYAYLGGPFMVLTLTNDGWGSQNFAAVCAHETGHIFYALDEYFSAATPCTDATGYLLYENQNSQFGTCLENVQYCIMRSVPIEFAELCTSTRGQVAWVDSDNDNIPNVIDTSPAVQIISIGKNGSATVTGNAFVTPLTNLNTMGNGNNISINTISSVQFQLDGAGWVGADPVDGSWSAGSEGFSFVPIVADSGTYHLEVRAVNSGGIISTAMYEADITIKGATGIRVAGVVGLPGTVHLLGNSPNPFNPKTEIHFYLAEGGDVAASIYDLRGGLIHEIAPDFVPMGYSSLTWNGTDQSGRSVTSGRYFYTLRSAGERVTGSMILLR